MSLFVQHRPDGNAVLIGGGGVLEVEAGEILVPLLVGEEAAIFQRAVHGACFAPQQFFEAGALAQGQVEH